MNDMVPVTVRVVLFWPICVILVTLDIFSLHGTVSSSSLSLMGLK